MTPNRVAALQARHQALEAEVSDEQKRPMPDPLRLGRLKSDKLAVKDQIEGVRQSASGKMA